MILLTNFLNKGGIAAGMCLLLAAGCGATGSSVVTSPTDEMHLRIAVLPVENLSNTPVPLDDIRQSLIGNLQRQGINVLDDAGTEQFLEKHRVRYTGGLDTTTSEAFKNEMNVDAVLITAVDLYSEFPPPRIAFLSRLVATGAKPKILWFDSVGLAGDDSPGLLGLTLIDDPKQLREKALGQLIESFAVFLAGSGNPDGARKVFRPKTSFRAPVVGTDLRVDFLSFVQNYSSGAQSMSPARLEVALSAVSGRPVAVEYAVTGGTAVAGKDYAVKRGTLTFAPGEMKKTIDIDIINKAIHDDDKTLEVSLRNPVNAVLGSTVMHAYTIINTTGEPSVAFTTEGQRIKENARPAAITVELSAISGTDVIVPFVVGGTAKTPSNYTITPSPLTIKAGARSAVITVTVSDNGIHEDDRTVVVTMGVPIHATQGNRTTSTVSIVDVDPAPAPAATGVPKPATQGNGTPGTATSVEAAPEVSFTQKVSSGDEKVSPARLEVVLSAVSGTTVQVEYAATGGTALKGRDYALLGNALIFDPGETKKSVELAIRNSGIYNDDKTIEVSLTKSLNSVLGNTTTHTFTILNTSPRPVAAFTSANQRFRKSVGRVVIPVQLSPISGKDVIVPFAASGSANEGQDYTITPSPLTIKAGMRGAEITIIMKREVPVEADKTIDLRLLNPDNALIGAPGEFTLTITKDTPPVIAVVPFVNASKRKNAAEIVMLQFVKELSKLDDFTAIEPGVVRQQLLAMRIIMYDGASLPDIDVLINSLDADLILTGKVFDYQDIEASAGTPKVDFSVMLVEKTSRKVIWASKSYNQGDDGVALFDWGLMNTASAMVSEMVRAVRTKLLTW